MNFYSQSNANLQTSYNKIIYIRTNVAKQYRVEGNVTADLAGWFQLFLQVVDDDPSVSLTNCFPVKFIINDKIIFIYGSLFPYQNVPWTGYHVVTSKITNTFLTVNRIIQIP